MSVRKKARTSAAIAVKAASSAVDRARRPARGAVVLVYHRVGGSTPSAVDLPCDLFARQMEWLAEQARAATLASALDAIGGPAPAGPDPIVVTFDDGTADFVDEALPVIVRHRIPALLYLTTGYVGPGAEIPNGGRPLSWAALGDALSTGLVTIGSHTHSHRLLDRSAPGEPDEELDRSVGLIGDHLGVAARHFAYPKAVPGSPAAEAAVRRRFRSAALGGTRPNRYGHTDPHRLARSPIQVSDGMRWFHRKALGGMELEDVLRRAVNRRRYATADR